jgi:hypothetical protein
MEDNPAFIGVINELAIRTMNTAELMKREDLVFFGQPRICLAGQFEKMATAHFAHLAVSSHKPTLKNSQMSKIFLPAFPCCKLFCSFDFIKS